MMDFWFVLTTETLNCIVILNISKFLRLLQIIVFLTDFNNVLMLNLQICKYVSIKIIYVPL